MQNKLAQPAKLLLITCVVGLSVGFIISIFAILVSWSNDFRSTNPWLVFLLPLAGVAIALIHKIIKNENPRGTNRVIERLLNNTYIKPIMAPTIFITTLISQFFGASVGREAAALQIGGSLASLEGKIFKVETKHASIIIMTGMSSAFSALFGTPLTAVAFALEIARGRTTEPKAIVPCLISAIISFKIGELLAVPYINCNAENTLLLTPSNFLYIIALALFCSLTGIIFSFFSQLLKNNGNKIIKNNIAKIFCTGIIIVILTLVVGDQTYNGLGSFTILECLTNENFKIVLWAFLLKILFTSISLSGGYQGGEIIPVLFIGATLGNAFSQFFPVEATLCSAIGMIGLFAATTKCPLASSFMSFELFGTSNMIFFLITIFISILFSFKFRIYDAQKLPFPKIKIGQ